LLAINNSVKDTLDITVTQGSANVTIDNSNPIGNTGATGPNGATGISAYNVWITEGNKGSIGDFIALLESF